MGDYGDAFNAAVAAELRAQRARVRMTIDELADQTGFAKSTVLHYLNGKRDIPLPAFGELCRVLGADAETIIRIAYEAAE